MAHKISSKVELSQWDAYGMGITILIMLNSLGSQVSDAVMFDIGFRMAHPNARKRLGLLDALDCLK
jgi:hypothetical protein